MGTDVVLSLEGRIVLVTRTNEGNAVEREKLKAHGAQVIELETIKISPPIDPKPIERALEELSSFDWIVFTSANGVETFFGRLTGNQVESIRANFACVGPHTSKALEGRGFKASLIPKEFLTIELGNELAIRSDIQGKKVLIARAEIANHEISSILRAAGADVIEAPVYRTVPATTKEFTDKDDSLDEVTDITIASPSAVDGLLHRFPAEKINSRVIRVHCIGPVTSLRAEQRGLRVSTTANEHTIDGLISMMISEERKK